MKLISMTEFVLLNSEIHYTIQSESEFYNVVINYANFLSQKLELWMFVPCKLVDGVWVVLEEPFNDGENDQYYSSAMQEYQEVKERCLFELESFTKNIIKSTYWNEYRFTFTNGKYFDFEDDTVYNVERLCELEPTLTQTAQKQLS